MNKFTIKWERQSIIPIDINILLVSLVLDIRGKIYNHLLVTVKLVPCNSNTQKYKLLDKSETNQLVIAI